MGKKKGGKKGKSEEQPKPQPSTSTPGQQASTSQPSAPEKQPKPEQRAPQGKERPQELPQPSARGSQETWGQATPASTKGTPSSPSEQPGFQPKGAWGQGMPSFEKGKPQPQPGPQQGDRGQHAEGWVQGGSFDYGRGEPHPGQGQRGRGRGRGSYDQRGMGRGQYQQGFQQEGPSQAQGQWGRGRGRGSYSQPGMGRGQPQQGFQQPQQQEMTGPSQAQGQRGRGRGRGGYGQPGMGRGQPQEQESWGQVTGPGPQSPSQAPGQGQRGRGRGRGGYGQPGMGREQSQQAFQQPQEQQSWGQIQQVPSPQPSQVPETVTPQLEKLTLQETPSQASLTDEEFKKLLPFKPGTLGRPINIETNHLKLNLGSLKQAYRYDVSVEPDKPKKMLKVAMKLFREAHFPRNYPSYDGQKLLYSAKKLPDDTISGSVTLKDDNGKDKEFKITIKLSGILDLSPLARNNLLQKNIGQSDVFQCVEIVFRQAYINSFINVGRKFYTPPPRQGMYPVGDGAEMYLGGYQAAIQGYHHFLNVDVAHKGFTTETNLVDLVNEMCSGKYAMSNEEMKSFEVKPCHREPLNNYLKGLKVVYQVPNHPGSKRVYKINSLQEPPSRASFKDENNQTTTVEAYFLKKYRYGIKYRTLPTVWVGAKGQILLPMECCTLQGGQPIDGNKMTDNQVSKMIRYAATSTTERKKKIQSIIDQAGYNRNPCIQEFGFSIADEFQKVGARVLQPPQLEYSKGRVAPNRGVWRGREFKKGAEIRTWTIVAVGLQRERVGRDIARLAQMIQNSGRANGVTFSRPVEPFDYIDPRNIVRRFEQLKNFDLIFVIIPQFKKDVYFTVKQTAEQRIGCLTQCIKSDTLKERKLNESTINNILLKVNSKLNGTNHIIHDLDLVSKAPCMVMGADVTHPSPQAKSIHPSVLAVTASQDLAATSYNIDTRLQKPRETYSEIIQDLEDITVAKLHKFEANTGELPERIYFFRDGVSDGEFERVKQVEVAAIQKACTRFKCKPKITFLVVQKRHHTRFFPLDKNATDGDKNFNVPAGTCVDTEIVSAIMQNFFLVSHASIQGVAKPTKYCTLYDENNLSNNDIQKLTYYLCHVFMRCNRAVSYPAPTYYAHLMADRAKGYLHGKEINMDQLDQRLIKTVDGFAENNPMFFS